ncbi:unnamed protein product, partial [Laminaria digitata]
VVFALILSSYVEAREVVVFLLFLLFVCLPLGPEIKNVSSHHVKGRKVIAHFRGQFWLYFQSVPLVVIVLVQLTARVCLCCVVVPRTSKAPSASTAPHRKRVCWLVVTQNTSSFSRELRRGQEG